MIEGWREREGERDKSDRGMERERERGIRMIEEWRYREGGEGYE